MAAVDWDGEIHVGNCTGTTKHFIAVREGGYIGTSKDGSSYVVVEIQRTDLQWLIESLQREIELAQRREN
jgi:hypothetical protein